MVVLDAITLTNIRLILVSLIAFLFTYVLIVFVKSNRSADIPPGPWCFPILGYFPNIAICSKFYDESMSMVYSRLSRKYGPVFSLYLGNQLYVVLNDKDVIKKAFMNPILNGRKKMKDEDAGIFTASGPSWKAQRAFTLGVFRRFGVGKSSFEKQIKVSLEKLLKQFDDKKQAPFDPKSIVSHAVFNVTSNIAIGKTYEYNDLEFVELLDNINQMQTLGGKVKIRSIVKFLRLFPTNVDELFTQAKEKMYSTVRNNIEHRKKIFSQDREKCLIDAYISKLNAKDELSPYLTDKTMTHTVTLMLIAGTDTSSCQILWILVYLLNYPDVMKKVQEEIDTIVGCDRLPELSDHTDLPFTQAVIYECMRLAAPAPLGTVHAAFGDTTLLDYAIPKGTLLIANIWGAHRDPVKWSKPNQFDPSRFLDQNGNLVENSSLLTFSTGRRVCIGENLARIEIFLFVSQILHQFNLAVPEGDPCPSLTETIPGFAYCPKPFSVIASPRHRKMH